MSEKDENVPQKDSLFLFERVEPRQKTHFLTIKIILLILMLFVGGLLVYLVRGQTMAHLAHRLRHGLRANYPQIPEVNQVFDNLLTIIVNEVNSVVFSLIMTLLLLPRQVSQSLLITQSTTEVFCMADSAECGKASAKVLLIWAACGLFSLFRHNDIFALIHPFWRQAIPWC